MDIVEKKIESDDDLEFEWDVNFSHQDFGEIEGYDRYIVRVTGLEKRRLYDKIRERFYDEPPEYRTDHRKILYIESPHGSNKNLTDMVNSSTLMCEAIACGDDDEIEVSKEMDYGDWDNIAVEIVNWDVIVYVYVLKSC
jgi:hypothetical protein